VLNSGDKLYFCILPDSSISIRIKKHTIFDIAGILKSDRLTSVSIEEMDQAIQQAATNLYLNTKK
jgi:hypothetical protein